MALNAVPCLDTTRLGPTCCRDGRFGFPAHENGGVSLFPPHRLAPYRPGQAEAPVVPATGGPKEPGSIETAEGLYTTLTR
jgi:hypothetical protein